MKALKYILLIAVGIGVISVADEIKLGNSIQRLDGMSYWQNVIILAGIAIVIWGIYLLVKLYLKAVNLREDDKTKN